MARPEGLPKVYLDHIYPEDCVTEQQRKHWRRTVRKNLYYKNIPPPTAGVIIPPAQADASFFDSETPSMGFLEEGEYEIDSEDRVIAEGWEDS